MLRYLALDDLVLHDLSDLDPAYWLEPERTEGFSEPQYRMTAYDKSGEDGGVVSNLLLGMRGVTLSGVVTGSGMTDYLSNRLALERACAITRDSNGRPEAKRITLETLDGASYFVDGYVQQLVVGSVYNDWATFLIQLRCPDPQIFYGALSSTGNVSRPTSSGFTLPLTLPLSIGTSTGGLLIANNYGSTDTWPIVTLRGEMTDPVLQHLGSGALMQLETTLTTNDEVVIDMKNRTIMLSGTTNLLSTKTSSSEWFALSPGTNTIQFTTGLTTDTGTAEVEFYPARLGV